MSKKAIVVGAGMAGCFAAVCLAKRGFDVAVFEARPDIRLEDYDSGRSFNLTLYYRGIEAMKKVGLWDAAKGVSEIAEGNVAHYEKKNIYDSFDAKGNEILYTVHRNRLNSALITAAERFDNVTFHFNTKCTSIDAKKKEVTVEEDSYKIHFEKGTKKDLGQAKMTVSNSSTIKADLVVGADGVHSVVRSQLTAEHEDLARQEYEEWGYKEVHISPELTKHMKLRLKATHTWPRPDSLLIAFPNPDKSFTLMFNLALKGSKSFESLTTKDKIGLFIEQDFPDLAPLLPEIINAFLNKKTGTFVTLDNPVWHDKNFAFLIGDAAHAFIPFYGQGMCAAFDDCLKFFQLYDRYDGNLGKVFPLYQANRKKNTDLMAQLARDNFVELRDKSRSPFFVLKDKADTLLHMLFPKYWQPPLYVLIAHGDLEYADAYELYKKQLVKSKKIGLDAALRALALPLDLAGKFKSKE